MSREDAASSYVAVVPLYLSNHPTRRLHDQIIRPHEQKYRQKEPRRPGYPEPRQVFRLLIDKDSVVASASDVVAMVAAIIPPTNVHGVPTTTEVLLR